MTNRPALLALSFALVFGISHRAWGEDLSDDLYRPVRFLILKSTKDYQEAARFVKDASARLGVKTELRGLMPVAVIGLTLPKQACIEDHGGYYPCYLARGREDDGVYLSIEYSDAYDGFSKGYFIVVGANGEEPVVNKALVNARKVFPDAYVKKTKVYYGCMH